MIVNLKPEGWEIIYHRAHGLLAVKLASHWRKRDRSPYWTELLAAITQHDNNQKEFRDDNYLTLLGAPADFMISSGDPLEQARSVVEDASYQGRYVALMTSLHTSYIYGAKRDDKAFAAFLDEQADLQRRWRRALRLKKAEAERHYAIMQWCDRCSLILCEDELPADSRRLEVTPLPSGERSYIWQRGDGTLGLEPWPFSKGLVEVSVEARTVERLQFGDDKALQAALRDAPTQVKTWHFKEES